MKRKFILPGQMGNFVVIQRKKEKADWDLEKSNEWERHQDGNNFTSQRGAT